MWTCTVPSDRVGRHISIYHSGGVFARSGACNLVEGRSENRDELRRVGGKKHEKHGFNRRSYKAIIKR